MSVSGTLLLQDVAVRIVARWLRERGKLDVQITSGREAVGGRAVDLAYAWQGSRLKIKVKPDPYFGSDEGKIRDRSLSFYRADAAAYAFESIANSATREPGWVSDSAADELYYYRLALGQTEDEVRALMGEPDEVFFSELWVDRDELVIDADGRGARAGSRPTQTTTSPRPVITGRRRGVVSARPARGRRVGRSGLAMVGPVFRSVSA